MWCRYDHICAWRGMSVFTRWTIESSRVLTRRSVPEESSVAGQISCECESIWTMPPRQIHHPLLALCAILLPAFEWSTSVAELSLDLHGASSAAGGGRPSLRKGALKGATCLRAGVRPVHTHLRSLIPPRHLAPHLYRESMHLSLQPIVSRTGSRIDVPESCD